ncbi:MAG TPA: hypothetical protein VLS25_00170 [Dehalococcoidia bacterium]|nr:hypothetical protein [Dehalococcoidia bacterium]
MAYDETVTELLDQLDAIANAPMTASQREMRASPLLAGAGVTVSEVVAAMSRPDLRWTVDKARECKVTVETWLSAVQAVGASPTDSLSELLDRIHRAEAAAEMMKAGYWAAADAAGRLTWNRG